MLWGGQAPAPTYASQVMPIFQQKCLACHSSAAKMGGLVMDSYDALMKGGTHGPAIVPGKGDESRLVLMLEGKLQPRMPFGGDPLPAADIAVIKGWIEHGAKAPPPGEVVTTAPKPVIPDIKPQGPVVSPVLSLAYSPDGKLIASGGYKEVRLIEPSTGKVLADLSGHADYVRSIAFSPDGKWLAAGGGPCQVSGEIKLWDVQLHKLLRSMTGHSDCIYSVAFSPDGKLLASASYDKLAKLWDASTGKEVRNLKDHIDAVFAVAFSPDGKWLATGSQDRSVKIWDVASGQRLYTLGDPSDGIVSLAFSPSGKQIAAGGYDKTIYVWNLTDKGGTLAHTLIADEDSILQILWSPDTKMIITSSADRSIRVRDSNSLDPISVFDNQSDWVEALTVSPNSRWLAAGRYDGTVSVYDLNDHKQVLGPLVAFETHEPAGSDSQHQAASR
jgi:WD40 repeat protein